MALLLASWDCLTPLTPAPAPLGQCVSLAAGGREWWCWVLALIFTGPLFINLCCGSSCPSELDWPSNCPYVSTCTFSSGLPWPFSPATFTSMVALVLMFAPQVFCKVADRAFTTVSVWNSPQATGKTWTPLRDLNSSQQQHVLDARDLTCEITLDLHFFLIPFMCLKYKQGKEERDPVSPSSLVTSLGEKGKT